MAEEQFTKPDDTQVWRSGAASSESPVPCRKEVWIYLGIWVFALLLRVVYLWQIRKSPMLSVLMSDSQSYDAWAQEIARGNWLGDKIFYQAPLYPYFLGLLYAVFGHNLLLVRMIQVILGATSCLFVAFAGRLFFFRSVGMLAGALLAVYPSAIYFDCLIQKSVLDLFLLSLFLFVLGLVGREARARWWIMCGAILGLLTLARENALVLVLAMIFWLFIRFRQETLARRMKWAGLVLSGLLLILFPVALRNKIVGGEFHLTTSQFGPNFYIGNNRNAVGVYTPLRPGRSNPEFEQQDATELAETALGRKLRPAEVSWYWTVQALSDLRSDPGGWLRLMARKWFLIWNAFEIADAEDQYTYGDSSPLLRGLNVVLHFGILCPLAVVGLAVTWKIRERLWVLYLTLVSYAASVAFFYVFARYRFPMVAWLVMFAAAGLIKGCALLRERQFAVVLTAAGLAVIAGIFVNWQVFNPDEYRGTTEYNLAFNLSKQWGKTGEVIDHYRAAVRFKPAFVEAHYNLAEELAAQGILDEAITHYTEALRLKPDLKSAHNNLGNVFVRRGQLEQAMVQYRQELTINPGLAEAHCNLAELLVAQGKLDEAITQYAETLRLKPDFAEAHFDLGNVFAVRGQLEAAVAHYREALRFKPGWSETRNNLGLALASLGQIQEAIAQYTEALRLKPANAEAHNNLGLALAVQGKAPEAIAQYQEALRLKPDYVAALNHLARILAAYEDAQVRNPAEAIRLAMRACELTDHRDPHELDTLAAAYAEVGRFPDAIQTGQKAADLAAAAGDEQLAHAIQHRVELYKLGKPYHEHSLDPFE
jgi:tetratricopeptide (TPR) repeat protein